MCNDFKMGQFVSMCMKWCTFQGKLLNLISVSVFLRHTNNVSVRIKWHTRDRKWNTYSFTFRRRKGRGFLLSSFKNVIALHFWGNSYKTNQFNVKLHIIYKQTRVVHKAISNSIASILLDLNWFGLASFRFSADVDGTHSVVFRCCFFLFTFMYVLFISSLFLYLHSFVYPSLYDLSLIEREREREREGEKTAEKCKGQNKRNGKIVQNEKQNQFSFKKLSWKWEFRYKIQNRHNNKRNPATTELKTHINTHIHTQTRSFVVKAAIMCTPQNYGAKENDWMETRSRKKEQNFKRGIEWRERVSKNVRTNETS